MLAASEWCLELTANLNQKFLRTHASIVEKLNFPQCLCNKASHLKTQIHHLMVLERSRKECSVDF